MPAERPNILILFTDMQRADTLRALGNPVIRTPNLDRLVQEGTAFVNCFSPSPVCVPARCSLHYGWYPQKTGVTNNGRMMADNGRSYPALLGEAGYRTHAIGKCHFTPDHAALRGFQSRQTQEECTSDPTRDDYVAWLAKRGLDIYEPHGARSEMYYIPQISTLPASAHSSQWVGNESLRFIKAGAEQKKPWCLFSSFIHPHPPFDPPKPWHKLYRAVDMPLPMIPPNPAALMTWVNRFQNRYKYRDRVQDLNLIRLIKAYYYATISFVDFQVGRILAGLEATGQLDRTLILFTSDHGEHLGDFNCFGKRSMHDASARVPMVVRYPAQFAAGRRCRTAVSLVDVFPTVLAAAGVEPAGLDLDGRDLAQIARGRATDRTVYSQFGQGQRAIYMGVNRLWKYVYSAGDDREFLFDRRNDPREFVNLAKRAEHRALRNARRVDILQFLKKKGAVEAYVEGRQGLRWRKYPQVDETYLENPDAELLRQDYPPYPLDLPGYA
jgi:choline-sulfatase